jgi:phage-related tail fiber protein
MPQDYFSLVTNQGLIKEAASNEPGGTAIDLTEMAVGDSNGTYYDPDGSETALVNEVHRVNLTHVVVDENNTNQLIVEAVLDETIGPFYIREVGIFDSNGDLFAIGKYPETFKPNLPAGSGKRLYIRMILGFANSPNVNLVINNDIALDPNFGTDVNNALAERLIKTNNLSDLSDYSTSRNNLDVYNKSQVDSAINNIITPSGSIISYAANTPPSGFLECNGAEISRSVYNDLFNAIGTTFGNGDGSTTFKIPDLRGEFIRGWNHGISSDPDAISRLDSGNGTSGDNIGTKQSWALENMTGSVNVSSEYGERAKIDGQTGVLTYRDTGNVYNAGAGGFATNKTRGITFDASLVAQTSSETRPRNIALMFCIKY